MAWPRFVAEDELIGVIRQPGFEQELSPWSDGDDAILAQVHRLVQSRAVNPDGLRSVNLSRPHGHQLSGPACQQELNLDHRPVLDAKVGQRGVDRVLIDR